MPPKRSSKSSSSGAGRSSKPAPKSTPVKSGRVAKATKVTPSRKAKNVKPIVEEEIDDPSDDDDDAASSFSAPEESAEESEADVVEDEEEDDAEDDEDDEVGGRKSWTVSIPKAREAGNVPYEDDTLHKNTFLFLKDLKAHNQREWLKMHDKDFRNAQKDFESFVDELGFKLMAIDPTIPELPKKDLIFRIYRDVRFSKDQTPYKAHFSVAWSRTGKKGPYAAYYFQIKPGNESFIGGGLWSPEALPLALLRNDVAADSQELKDVLQLPALRDVFFKGVKRDEKALVKAFIAQNASNALKTKPKGFDADHKDIGLLRLRRFTIGVKLSDEEVLGEGGMGNVMRAMEGLVPWVTYLNSVVMPDRT